MLKLRSVVVACLSACVLVLGLTSPASAHAISSARFVTIFDPLHCVHNTSLIDDGPTGGGHSLAETSIWLQGLSQATCGPAVAKPAGWIAARMDLYMWSPKTDRWAVCREMKGWVLTKAIGYKLVATADWRTPCGPGYYATRTQSGLWDGTAWTGLCCVSFWSGWYPSNGQDPYSHWLPVNKPAQKQQLGPIPAVVGYPTAPYWGEPDTHQLPANGGSWSQSTDENGAVTTYRLRPEAFIAYTIP